MIDLDVPPIRFRVVDRKGAVDVRDHGSEHETIDAALRANRAHEGQSWVIRVSDSVRMTWPKTKANEPSPEQLDEVEPEGDVAELPDVGEGG